MAGYKGNYLAAGFLNLLFNNTAFTNVATGTGYTNFYVSLHTVDPGSTNFQNTGEIVYSSYARQPVARNSSNIGWVVDSTNQKVSPNFQINFPACNGGAGGNVAYFAIGTDSAGSGNLLYAGPVSPSIPVVNGVTPQLLSNSTITES